MNDGVFFGLDLETSAVDVYRGAVPIQIGIATREGRLFSRYIGGWDFNGPHQWNFNSYKIHRIPQEVIENAPYHSLVAEDGADFVNSASGQYHRNRRWVVGWNVAGFDMPFIHKYLPVLSKSLSYRTVDLNALVFACVEAGLRDVRGIPYGYEELKKFVKTSVEYTLLNRGYDPDWHDAGYDALASIEAYYVLVNLMRNAMWNGQR